MDCHQNENKQICLNFEAQKCDLLHEEKLFSIDESYFECMEKAYSEIYGEQSSLDFCHYAYGKSSDIYEEDEKHIRKAFGKNMF